MIDTGLPTLALSPQMKGNIPLFLKCGHTMCETCITNIIKFAKRIQCKFCKRNMEVEETYFDLVANNKTDLYQKFPINTTVFGEIILQNTHTANTFKQEGRDLDLNEWIKSCQARLDEWTKSTDTSKETSHTENTCKLHNKKQKELYCMDCNKAVCIHCMTDDGGKFCQDCNKEICIHCIIDNGEKFCMTHNVVAVNDMNEAHIRELSENAPTVEEVLKRLTKTAVDVGSLIQSVQCDSNIAVSKYVRILCNIEQHFSKINFAVQKHKEELIDIVNQMKTSELASLQHIQEEIKSSIKKTTDILSSIDRTMKSRCPEGNIEALLEEAKLVANTPCYLHKVIDSKEPVKLEVYENLCTLVTDYIFLQGNLKTDYKLYTTEDINGTDLPSAPKGIVYPPKVTEDKLAKNIPEQQEKSEPIPIGKGKLKEKRVCVSSDTQMEFTPSDMTESLYDPKIEMIARSNPRCPLNYFDVSPLDHPFTISNREAHQLLKYPESKYLMENMIESDSYRSRKAAEKVYISCVESPAKFFVVKEHLQRFCEKLTKDLEHQYSMASNTNTDSIYFPEVGMLYAVNLENRHEHGTGGASAADGAGAEGGARWARGLVRELVGRGVVRVELPDSGATLLLHRTRLKYLYHKYFTFSAMASECYLAGLTPINIKWSAGSIELLNTFKDKLLEVHVEDTSRQGSFGVTLFDNSDESNVICINKEMITHKFAFTFGLFKFNQIFAIEEQEYTNQPNEMPKPKPKEKILTKACVAAGKPRTEEHNLEAFNEGPIGVEARVLYYQSPSLIYVSILAVQKIFDTLFRDIQAYYSNNKTQAKEDWKEGDRCCTLSGILQTWQRAYILEKEDNYAKIFYSDFAGIATVPLTDLRELTPEFTNYPDAAVKCHLAGLMSAYGKEWPNVTIKNFENMLDAYPRIFLRKNGCDKNDSQPVEIWVYDIVINGAAPPNTAEWRCLNNQLIEEGFAILASDSVKVSADEDEAVNSNGE